MYRIPNDLNLDKMIGSETTQLRVGQFDIQFTFGKFDFVIETNVQILKGGKDYASWVPGSWPEKGFYEIMNTEVVKVAIVGNQEIQISLSNGLTIQLIDASDQYESFQITEEGSDTWIV